MGNEAASIGCQFADLVGGGAVGYPPPERLDPQYDEEGNDCGDHCLR